MTYRRLIDDFVDSGLNVSKVSCGDVFEAERVRKGLYFPSLGRNVKVMRRGNVVYLVRDES